MSNIDKNKLRELAMAATPGPWDFDSAMTPFKIAGGEPVGGDALPYGDVYTMQEFETPDGSECLTICEEIGCDNGRFISAVDPQTILALLDEIDTLKAQAARVAVPDEKLTAMRENAELVMARLEQMHKDSIPGSWRQMIEDAMPCMLAIINGLAAAPTPPADKSNFEKYLDSSIALDAATDNFYGQVQPLPVDAAVVERIDIIDGDYLVRSVKTTGENGWLLYRSDGKLIRALNLFEEVLVDYSLDATHPTPAAQVGGELLPKGWRAELQYLRDNTETFGMYSQEAARIAIEGCIDALDDLEAEHGRAAQSVKAGVVDERAEFEKALKKEWTWQHDPLNLSWSGSVYNYEYTDIIWRMWQARAALTAKEGE